MKLMIDTAALLEELHEIRNRVTTGGARKAVEACIASMKEFIAFAQRQVENVVPVPKSLEQAKLMALLGMNWLRDHAPEELTFRKPQPPVTPELIDSMCVAYWGPNPTRTWADVDEPFKNEMRSGMRQVLRVMQEAEDNAKS